MIIRAISVENACGIERRTVVLPERGLVLVTGPNGSGKSAVLVDAPAAASWGRTVRDAPVWAADGSGGKLELAVTVVGVDVSVIRQKAKRVALSFMPGGTNYDTASKAQPELERLVGTFDSWRRTRVFSGEDAVALSIASKTDGQLKRLVEQLLGVDFAGALESCRKDLRRAERAAADAEASLSAAEATERAATLAFERARAAAAAAAPTEAPPDTAKLARRLKSVQALLSEARAEARKLEAKRGSINSDIRMWAQSLGLIESGACGECGRPFGVADEVTAANLRGFIAVAKARRESLSAEEAALDIHALEGDVADRERELVAAERLAAVLAERASHHARAAAEVVRARAACGEAATAREAAEAAKATAAAEVATFTAVESVLGLKGPRTRIVQHALLTVEATANRWLAALSLGHMRVELTAGDVMRLEGAGGGHGYVAASRGQRRRVDLALWLGLSELAPAYRGGTMLIDEALDGLDSEGREAAVRVVEELAATQCVVMISHDERLARALAGRVTKTIEMGGEA